MALMQSGDATRHSEVLRGFERALQLAPSDVAYNDLAYALIQQGPHHSSFLMSGKTAMC